MTENVGTTTDVAELVHRFVDAFNARDRQALNELVAEDTEFRTRDGRALRGHDGARELLMAAEDAGIRLEAAGDPEADGDRVTLPVRVVTGPGDTITGTAIFEVRGGTVASFHVEPDE